MSTYFSPKEFLCPCCNQGSVSELLLEKLEILRSSVGRALHVNSGWRCAKHNAAVGGAVKSQHLRGLAAALSLANWSDHDKSTLFRMIEALEFGGVGRYQHFVHVDVRESGPARWGIDA